MDWIGILRRSHHGSPPNPIHDWICPKTHYLRKNRQLNAQLSRIRKTPAMVALNNLFQLAVTLSPITSAFYIYSPSSIYGHIPSPLFNELVSGIRDISFNATMVWWPGERDIYVDCSTAYDLSGDKVAYVNNLGRWKFKDYRRVCTCVKVGRLAEGFRKIANANRLGIPASLHQSLMAFLQMICSSGSGWPWPCVPLRLAWASELLFQNRRWLRRLQLWDPFPRDNGRGQTRRI